jgi:hypothetical protein
MVLNWSVCEGVDRLAQEESLPRLGVLQEGARGRAREVGGKVY